MQSHILVAGAGLTGSLAALALAHTGCRVTLVDPATRAHLASPRYDGRSTALSAGTLDFLDTLGLKESLLAAGEPIRTIRIVDVAQDQHILFDPAQTGRDALGLIIDNTLLRQQVFAALLSHPHVTLLEQVRVTGFADSGATLTANLGNGSTLSAQLLVAADGRTSPLRQQAGIGVQQKTYPHHGLTFPVRHTLPHHGVAFECFRQEGPLALLPLQGSRSSVIWMLPAATARQWASIPEKFLSTALQQAFGRALGEFTVDGPRSHWPLTRIRANRLGQGRLVLLGEAAHAMHPIAGQGFNLSVRDVMTLTAFIRDNIRLGLDPADGLAGRYHTARQPDMQSLLVATDTLDRLFQVAFAPVRVARGLGVAVVQQSDTLRQLFMQHAMGLSPLALSGIPRLQSP